ncbi:MAG TPA: phosphate signaling complex protein PhoU [Chloroflexota bacterium]|nr:phosphate signaling complex protein PhoU [Chloroflexota bacterium]
MTREHYRALLQQLDDEVLALGDLVAGTIAESVDALERLDVERAQSLIVADSRIDRERYDVENKALVLMATQQPAASDLRTITATLIIASELERIADYCEGIAKITLRMAAEPVPGTLSDIRTMADVTEQLLRQALQALKNRDVEAAGEVWRQDDDVDELYESVFRRMLVDMTTNKATVRRSTYLLWVAHNLERIADRVTNITERIAFIVTGDIAGFRDKLRAESLPA